MLESKGRTGTTQTKSWHYLKWQFSVVLVVTVHLLFSSVAILYHFNYNFVELAISHNGMWKFTDYSLYLEQLEEKWIIIEDYIWIIVVLWRGVFSPFVAQRPAWRNHCSQGTQLSDINKDSFGETKKSHSEIALKFKIKRCSNRIFCICQRFMTSAKWL